MLLTENWTLEQEIMDKFEFFPIKCRTQRAADFHQQFHNMSGHSSISHAADAINIEKPLKTKAC